MKHIITLFFLLLSLNLFSQRIIIAEDVVMLRDTQSYIIVPVEVDSTVFKIERLKLDIEELKSQVKEISILLLTLIQK